MIAPLLAAAAPAAAVHAAGPTGQVPPAAPAPPPVDPAAPIAGDWRAIPDDQLLVMTLAGNRTVVIRLAARQAPEHVANVRRLALAHYWDGTSVYRVQDNWVAQWGGQPDDPPNDAANRPLPPGVAKAPVAEYELAAGPGGGAGLAQRMDRADAYSAASGITPDGWAVATDGTASWLTHCYGSVGVARDPAPDTGSGSELFMPLGGSARRLDRSYAIVGRVVEGARFLSGLPRSDAPAGVYADRAQRVPIVSVRLASALPAAVRPRFEYRAADNPRFAAMIAARRHPPATPGPGGIDVCDVPLPVRRAPATP